MKNPNIVESIEDLVRSEAEAIRKRMTTKAEPSPRERAEDALREVIGETDATVAIPSLT